MTEEQRTWIDNASTVELLRKWRYAISGDPYLQGDTGKHFSNVMFKKRDADPAAWTAASKEIGWG